MLIRNAISFSRSIANIVLCQIICYFLVPGLVSMQMFLRVCIWSFCFYRENHTNENERKRERINETSVVKTIVNVSYIYYTRIASSNDTQNLKMSSK